MSPQEGFPSGSLVKNLPANAGDTGHGGLQPWVKEIPWSCWCLVTVVSNSATPWTAAHQASLSFTISQSLLKFTSIESVMLSNHLLCSHFPSCLQYFPASGSFPVSWLFTSGDQRTGTSASAPVLPMNIQVRVPLGLTCLILLSKDYQESFPAPQFKSINSLGIQPSLWSNSLSST